MFHTFFQADQCGLEVSHVAYESSDNSSAQQMFDKGGKLEISTPWVAGTADFHQSKQVTTKEKSGRANVTIKVHAPVGNITVTDNLIKRGPDLSPEGLNADIDRVKGETTGSGYFTVNGPNFIKFVETQIGKGINGEELRKNIRDCYGDVIAMGVTIGVAAYSSKAISSQEHEELEEAINAARFGAIGAAGEGPPCQGSNQSINNTHAANAAQLQTFNWHYIGGGSYDIGTNPLNCLKYRFNPHSWRVISIDPSRLVPIVNFLPEHIRSQLDEPEIETPQRERELQLRTNWSNLQFKFYGIVGRQRSCWDGSSLESGYLGGGEPDIMRA